MGERKRTVLVLDDAGEMIVLCVNILQALGYAVKGANRPEVALDLLGKESFDLMIVDYRMPQMNGFQVFERARLLRPEMAFMLLTGHGSADVMHDAAERGFHAICLKPFTRDRLRSAVEQALRQRA